MHTRTTVHVAGVRPALTCEDQAISREEKRNKKRALTDKSKKSAAKKAAKPMSKAEGKKKKAVKSKASSSRSKAGSSLPWFDSSDEDGPQVPVVTARIVGVDSDAGSDSSASPPYDSDNPARPDGDSSD